MGVLETLTLEFMDSALAQEADFLDNLENIIAFLLNRRITELPKDYCGGTVAAEFYAARLRPELMKTGVSPRTMQVSLQRWIIKIKDLRSRAQTEEPARASELASTVTAALPESPTGQLDRFVDGRANEFMKR